MISDTMILISIAGLLVICVSKIINLISRGENKDLVFSLLEFGASLILLLFLLFAQFAAIQASHEQPLYEGEVFEATQYLLFGSFLVPVIFGFTVFEILFSFGIIGYRGRLSTGPEN